MKFSQKIFFVSFTLMILSMYIMGGWMITYNHKINIDREHTRSVEENIALQSAVKETIPASFDTVIVQEQLKSIVSRMSDTSLGLSVEIDRNDQLFCTIGTNKPYKPSSILNKTGYIGTIIRDAGTKTLLYSYSKIKIDNAYFSIYTARDITPVYTARLEQIRLFINISVLLTLLSALLLAIVIYFVTRKIKHLQEEAEKVAQGDYSAKIAISGHDEVADLCQQFNTMIDSVNRNMADIRQTAENRKLFISDLTHEIRSPLTSIIGYSELLKNVKITEEDKIQRYAEKIHEDGKYIEQLSSSLTQLVLLGNHSVDRSMTDLSVLLKKALIMAQDMLSGYHIPFEAAIQPGVKKIANPQLIQSTVINLLKNACKASQPGNHIKVVLDQEKLSVADQGKGIPLEELERIREPFYQVDNKARTRQEKRGLGLGLPLCIKIAELHGWQLIIQSKVGTGTTVTIFFNKEELQ